MKNILFIFLMLITFNVSAEVSTTGLTETQIAELALSAAKMKESIPSTITKDGVVETLSEFGSLGKETGEAIKYALLGVVDIAEKFSDTDVGKITIALVIWRIAGVDLVMILFMFGIIVVVTILFRVLWRRPIESIEYKDDVMLWGFLTRRIPDKIVYDTSEEAMKEYDNRQAVAILFVVAGAIISVIILINLG